MVCYNQREKGIKLWLFEGKDKCVKKEKCEKC